jgi:hypothetical protein
MGASVCHAEPRTTTQAEPLTLRYLLNAHAGLYNATRAAEAFAEFGKRPPLELVRAPARHTAWGVRRRP